MKILLKDWKLELLVSWESISKPLRLYYQTVKYLDAILQKTAPVWVWVATTCFLPEYPYTHPRRWKLSFYWMPLKWYFYSRTYQSVEKFLFYWQRVNSKSIFSRSLEPVTQAKCNKGTPLSKEPQMCVIRSFEWQQLIQLSLIWSIFCRPSFLFCHFCRAYLTEETTHDWPINNDSLKLKSMDSLPFWQSVYQTVLVVTSCHNHFLPCICRYSFEVSKKLVL